MLRQGTRKKDKDDKLELSLIEDQGQTDHITALPFPYTLDINIWRWLLIPRQAVAMIHTHKKTEVQ